jgi:ubiquinone/menaquinone biosynthesis C-methylase UbiE
MDVVDLCAGDGWFTLPIARRVRRVVAIDIDDEMLARARRRCAENRTMNAAFIAGDAYDIATLVEAPVDYVFLANAFHGVPDKPRLARSIRVALKPGGFLAIVNWHARPRAETIILGEPRGPATELRMTPQATIASVEPSGLKHRDVVEVSPYHYAAVFANAT